MWFISKLASGHFFEIMPEHNYIYILYVVVTQYFHHLSHTAVFLLFLKRCQIETIADDTGV